MPFPPSLQPAAPSHIDLQTPCSPLRQHVDPDSLPFPAYFTTLQALHDHAEMTFDPPPEPTLQDRLLPCRHSYPAVTPSTSSHHAQSSDRPKLVVCHDFQGGYSESPHHASYSFEHWHLVDTLIYFSHHRVTLPPLGWVRAAERNATAILGTLIFEWAESVSSLSLLLRGPSRTRLPHRGGPSFSPFYADLLIELALSRGLSGWLINIEVPLDLGFACSGEAWPPWVGEAARRAEMRRNAQRVRAWLAYLRREGEKRCPRWQVVWYDSVTLDGDLAWQDAVTARNAGFFDAASSVFTNYTWARPPVRLPPGGLAEALEPFQQRQAEGYGLTGPQDGGFHPALQLSAAVTDRLGRRRSDVLVGIDVFGRNCYGGMESCKALDMVGPHRGRRSHRPAATTALELQRQVPDQALGLSVALFAPGWTWEHDEPSRTGRSWQAWWHEDSRFWLGHSTTTTTTHADVALATATAATLTLDDEHLQFKAVSDFFVPLPDRPDRLARRSSPCFYTNFALGSGERWYVDGQCVYDWTVGADQTDGETGKLHGWTDPATSMAAPDLLYALRDGSWRFWWDEVWSGTVSIKVGRLEAAWRLPICCAVLTLPPEGAERTIRASAVFRYGGNGIAAHDGAARVKLCLVSAEGVEVQAIEESHVSAVGSGPWRRTSTLFRLPTHVATPYLPLEIHLESSTAGQVLLGSVSISPILNDDTAIEPRCTFTSSPAHRLRNVEGVLEWDDFDPSAAFYQIFAAIGTEGKEVWLGTATREVRRTEAVFTGLDLASFLPADETSHPRGVDVFIRSIREDCPTQARCTIREAANEPAHPL